MKAILPDRRARRIARVHLLASALSALAPFTGAWGARVAASALLLSFGLLLAALAAAAIGHRRVLRPSA
jgi:hypothetical protein